MGGADPCQGVCLVVVGPWYVKELAPFKVPTDLLDEESVARHVSPESDSIFIPPVPDAAGSDWRNPAGGTGTSTTGPGTAVVAPGPGTSEPGPGTAAVGPGTATTQEAVADSDDYLFGIFQGSRPKETMAESLGHK